MKYFILAGEASGDLHGSNLMKALKRQDPQAEFAFWGGDLMATEGGTLLKHYRDLAFMGVVEVLVNIGTILRNFRLCRQQILHFAPDVVVMIDYPGFNLKMSQFCHQQSIPVYYYISPKIWAWKKSRIKLIRRYVDRMAVILPFEVPFYESLSYPVEYVGNPLLDAIAARRPSMPDKDLFLKNNSLSPKPIIALLAGSRKQEIKRLLPVMLSLPEKFPDYQFVIAGAPSLPPQLYKQYTYGQPVRIVYNQTYELLNHAYAAVVTSGTATLETALFRVPQVVIYKANRLSYQIAILFVKVPFFSLVNLIAGREIVKEFLQNNLEKDTLAELRNILSNKDYYNQILKDYDELVTTMGEPGVSERVARSILNLLKCCQEK